jgi:hypothetical protein
MFAEKSVLVLEENFFLGLDLTVAIEELDGRVIGPARSIDEAMELLNETNVAAAIVDCGIPGEDVERLTDRLCECHVPYVLHTSANSPAKVCTDHPEVPLLRKPLQPKTVLACLLVEMRKSGR